MKRVSEIYSFKHRVHKNTVIVSLNRNLRKQKYWQLASYAPFESTTVQLSKFQ